MILEEIIARKREYVAKLQPFQEKPEKSKVNFLKAITMPGLNVIGEVKQKSPSTGLLCSPYLPEQIALQYKLGGVAAISVLTDTPFFGGKMQDIAAVQAATGLPVLCKDFIIDERQIEIARSMGADAVLLIMRILELEQVKVLKSAIEALGMLALIEIFDASDLEKALSLNPQVIMINHRDLNTLAVDMQTENLLGAIPQDLPIVAASGINAPHQVLALSSRINAVLIGTGLLRSPAPAEFIAKIRRLTCQAL